MKSMRVLFAGLTMLTLASRAFAAGGAEPPADVTGSGFPQSDGFGMLLDAANNTRPWLGAMAAAGIYKSMRPNLDINTAIVLMAGATAWWGAHQPDSAGRPFLQRLASAGIRNGAKAAVGIASLEVAPYSPAFFARLPDYVSGACAPFNEFGIKSYTLSVGALFHGGVTYVLPRLGLI